MQMKCASRVRLGIGCSLAVLAGWAQATALTSVSSFAGNTTWQNIAGVSYTYADTNTDGLLDAGDTVTFSVDMGKAHWGTHKFDAMKIWLDDGAGNNLLTRDFKWNFWKDTSEKYRDHKDDGSFTWKDWQLGSKSFSFSFTFEKASTYNLSVSVMCSRDLSNIDGAQWTDTPDAADWAGWTKNFHNGRPTWQGEDKNYLLTVAATPPVPEPETYAMLMAGLGLIGAVARRKKRIS